MDGPPPPPPPPHGANPGNTAGGSANEGGYRRSTDLPDGPYDIFIVPPHSSGSGFLYLPSLQCHRNSFLAGAAATLVAVALYINVLPVLKAWFSTVVASGGMGVFFLVTVVAIVGWALGRTQTEAGGPGQQGGPGSGASGGSGPRSPRGGGNPPGAGTGSAGPNPPPGGHQYQNFGGQYTAGGGFSGGPYPSGQYPGGQQHTTGTPEPGPGSSKPEGNKQDDWEKAREETRKREETKRRMDEFRRKKKEEEEQKQKKEREEKEEKEQQRKREAREREFREWKEKRAKEKAEKEAAEKAAAEKAAREEAKQETAAKYAAAREARAAKSASSPSPEKPAGSKPSTPQKKPPFASVNTEAEDDAYSFRPYDRPRSNINKPSAAAPPPSIFSESSYAPSQSTARTTPPPSHRGPYTTKDPDKIIIRGVYTFNNTFMRTPTAQLISATGHVTDGLILRITPEGMFVDDDVRGIAQREWDIKAWTMKLVEVWCPLHRSHDSPRPSPAKSKFRFGTSNASSKAPTSEESDAWLAELLNVCKNQCRLGTGSGGSSRSKSVDGSNMNIQTAVSRGYHVIRTSLKDQEGKKYVFVLRETEGWKVAMGLQKLKKGSQVRALGVCGLPANETTAILGSLGY